MFSFISFFPLLLRVRKSTTDDLLSWLFICSLRSVCYLQWQFRQLCDICKILCSSFLCVVIFDNGRQKLLTQTKQEWNGTDETIEIIRFGSWQHWRYNKNKMFEWIVRENSNLLSSLKLYQVLFLLTQRARRQGF